MKGCENCFCRFEYIYDSCPYCGSKDITNFSKGSYLQKVFNRLDKKMRITVKRFWKEHNKLMREINKNFIKEFSERYKKKE